MSAPLKGALWMIGAVFAFSIMAIAGRVVSAEFDTFEIMLYRSLFGLFIVSGVVTMSGTWAQVTTQRLGLHVVRNMAHFAGQNLWFFALPLIPLAQLFALEFTTPIWVLLFSVIFLSERLTASRILSAVLAFLGILIIARPDAAPLSLGLISAAGSAVCFGVTIIMTKRLTQTASITCILFHLTFMQALFGLICAGFDGVIALPDIQHIPWLFIIGCAGLMAHFCMTNALAIAPATVVVPVDFARLPLIAIIGVLLYGEALDPWVLVGALLIFAANYWNIWKETRGSHPVPAK